jgi:putative lipase involved disintegration of autophagic bodies
VPHPLPRLRSAVATDETLWEKQNLYNNITAMYPDANIWVIGHSLGGALASLLGITFGAPVVAFEPPGERMAAQRLHLPSPVRHFQS